MHRLCLPGSCSICGLAGHQRNHHQRRSFLVVVHRNCHTLSLMLGTSNPNQNPCHSHSDIAATNNIHCLPGTALIGMAFYLFRSIADRAG